GCRKVLPDRAVMADNDAEPGGVQPSDDPGPERFEGIAILTAKHGPIGTLPPALADIIPNAVAKDVLQSIFPGDVPRLLAYDHRQLSLGLHRSGTFFRHNDVLLRADERMHRAKIWLGSGRVVWD